MTTAKARKNDADDVLSCALRDRSRVEIGAAVGLVNGARRAATRAERRARLY
jgi:hypothetical protein